MTNFEEIYAAKKAEMANLATLQQREATLPDRKKEILKLRKTGQNVQPLWAAFNKERQEIRINIQNTENKLKLIEKMAFDIPSRRRNSNRNILPSGKNRRGNSAWMAPFWEMSSELARLRTEKFEWFTLFKEAKDGSKQEKEAGKELTRINTEFRQLKTRWAQAEASLRKNQVKKMANYGPKLVAI